MKSEERIYRHLIEGLCAKEIHKRTKLSKGYISKIIRRLEQKNLVRCINHHEKIKFYVKTSFHYNQNAKKVKNEKFPRYRHRREIVQIQKCSFKSTMKYQPTKGKWDSEYDFNGVKVHQYSHPFKDFGTVVFRWFEGKDGDTLVIILPRFLINREELDNIEMVLYEYAFKSCTWIKKQFNMVLTNPVMSQSPDYCATIREPELIDAVDKCGTFKVGDVWCDKSKPHSIPEFESKDKRDVINYLDSINKIKYIDDMVIENRKLINGLSDSVVVLSENQSRIIDFMNKKENNLDFGREFCLYIEKKLCYLQDV